jgi:cell division protein FtsI (penicillin-binding protein 3)
VLVKSSNIGAAKIALELTPDSLYDTLEAAGFGTTTGIELPGERSGVLVRRQPWRDIELATLSYGYGLSATPLQLARAYATLANDGRVVPVTMLRRDRPVTGERVLPAEVTRTISRILVDVVSPEGTARRARVPGYLVAGKTGTVHKLGEDGYLKDRYQSLFAGYAPASAPRFAMVVVIDDPRGKAHYGGAIAAPVFAGVIEAAMRLYSIPPDDPRILEASRERGRAGGDA